MPNMLGAPQCVTPAVSSNNINQSLGKLHSALESLDSRVSEVVSSCAIYLRDGKPEEAPEFPREPGLAPIVNHINEATARVGALNLRLADFLNRLA